MVVLLHVSMAALKTVVLLVTVRFSEGWGGKKVMSRLLVSQSFLLDMKYTWQG